MYYIISRTLWLKLPSTKWNAINLPKSYTTLIDDKSKIQI